VESGWVGEREGIKRESQGGGNTQFHLEIRDKFWCLACLHSEPKIRGSQFLARDEGSHGKKRGNTSPH
jgi:hypothetical protein